MNDALSQALDTVWIPAVPLPFQGWRTDRCAECGQKFRGKNRRHEYELHYRRMHEDQESPAQMAVTRWEAQRIYKEVGLIRTHAA